MELPFLNPDERYVTLSQAREMLGVTWNLILRLTSDGGPLPKIKHPHDKRMRLIPVSAIKAYQAQQENIPKATYHKSKTEEAQG